MVLWTQLLTSEEKDEAEKCAELSDDEKVFFIYMLARNQRWHRGVTNRELATIWGLTVDRVSKLSEMARMVVLTTQREAFKRPDDLRFELKQICEDVRGIAMAATKPIVVRDADGATSIEYVPAPDLKTVLASVRQESELFGLGTRRLIKQANKDYDEMSLDELEAEALKVLEERNQRLLETSQDADAIPTEALPNATADSVRGADPEPGPIPSRKGRRQKDRGRSGDGDDPGDPLSSLGDPLRQW